MKAFLASVIFAVALAIGASVVLNGNYQMSASTAFTTEAARVGNPGANLLSN